MNARRVGIHFTLDCVVHDVRAFVKAARARAIEEGVDPADARETYSARDLAACAVMLLDPGTLVAASIHGSAAEEWEA